MVGWHHQLNGHEFEQTLGDSEGQGSLACCSPWGSQRVRHDLVTEKKRVFRKWHNLITKRKNVTLQWKGKASQIPLLSNDPVLTYQQ